MPGCKARLSGNENDEELALAKPGARAMDADEDVRRLFSSEGFVEDVYWPGSSRMLIEASCEDSTAPANVIGGKYQDCSQSDLRLTRDVGIALKALTRNANNSRYRLCSYTNVVRIHTNPSKPRYSPTKVKTKQITAAKRFESMASSLVMTVVEVRVNQVANQHAPCS